MGRAFPEGYRRADPPADRVLEQGKRMGACDKASEDLGERGKRILKSAGEGADRALAEMLGENMEGAVKNPVPRRRNNTPEVPKDILQR